MKTVVALAGGVGAAKFLSGLTRIISPQKLLIIGNTGDDLELYGLHISPDLDIVMYTLAGVVDESKGWGIKNDTYNTLDMLNKLGFDTWFKLGDRDLATHIVRTKMIKEGMTLAEATAHLCGMFGVKARLTPMTNQTARTKIISDDQILGFQEYFVKNQTKNRVTDVVYKEAAEAEPAPGIIEALGHAERIIICPSNPVLSIAPILAVPKIRKAILDAKAHVVAISPIIAGKTLRGPADKILTSMGYKCSAEGVAEYYGQLVDRMIIDRADAAHETSIRKLGQEITVTDTVMRNLEDSIQLAKTVVQAQ